VLQFFTKEHKEQLDVPEIHDCPTCGSRTSVPVVLPPVAETLDQLYILERVLL
jgi:hypothetical protein